MSDSDLVVSLSYPRRIICVHLIVRSGPAKLLTYLLIFRREEPDGTSALESADGRFIQRTAGEKPYFREISRRNQALAAVQRRLAVATESDIAWAASSMVSPAK